MNINDVFPSKYLKAGDLPSGVDVPVQIARVDIVNVGTAEQPEDKPVVSFMGKDKALVLNITNANAIAGQLGPETDGWIGKTIYLFATQTDFRGTPTPCIRVRLQPPQPAPTAPPQQVHTPLSEDDIPFAPQFSRTYV